MPLLVVGSVAIDNVETPEGGRHDNLLGGSATHFSYAASFFTSVRLVGVVGEDWPAEHTQLLQGRGIDTTGLQQVAGGKTFPWTGRYEPNMNDRETLDVAAERLRRVRPGAARGLSAGQVRLPGQRRAGRAAEGARPDARAGGSPWPTRWTSGSKPSADDLDAAAGAARRPGAQRQRGQAADRHREPRAGGPPGPRDGAEVRRHQEGRARRDVLQRARDLRPARLPDRSTWSIRPAPATASPAA